uniref:MFS domain-containing protein n=1 Tax=Panagrellus redivivus TaxID=6233 RepID=A0A7E4W9T0_PANRE
MKASAVPKLSDFVQLGHYTVLVCLLSELMILCQVGNMIFMMFAGSAPRLIACGDIDLTTYPNQKEACTAYETYLNTYNGTKCVLQYDSQFGSVNVEWNYICSDAKQVKHSTSIQMIGIMLGSVIFGIFSDNYGRKKAMMVSLIGCAISMLATSFTHNLTTFTIARFIVSAFNGGSIAVNLVYTIENIPKQHRLWISNVVAWAPNYIIFAIMAYVMGEWRGLSQLASLLTVPAIIMCGFMPESAQFLAHRGQIDEAEAVVERICKIDGRDCDKDVLTQALAQEKAAFEAQQAVAKNYTFFDLFHDSKYSLYTVVLSVSFMIASIVNYGLIFNMEKLSGSIYMNAIIIGCLRYLLNLTVAVIDYKCPKVGRKLIHLWAWMLIVTACFLIFAIQATGAEAQLKYIVRFAAVSVIATTAHVYTSNGILSGELFPTCVRNLSYSFSQFHSRLGVVIAPQLFLLLDGWPPAIFLALGILGFYDMIVFHFAIPETKGHPCIEAFPAKKVTLPNAGDLEVQKLTSDNQN